MKITRTFDLLENFRKRYQDKDDVLAGKENGKWIKYGVNDYVNEANAFSHGLLAMGLTKGDKIVTITNNRPEWNFIDMGMAQVGVVHVPIYPTISKDDYYYILTHCQPKLIIVSDKNLYDKICAIAGMAGVKAIYTINVVEGAPNWLEIKEKGNTLQNEWAVELKKIQPTIQTHDLFTIIYTSGTTGFPKGVMLSHYNIIQNAIATADVHTNGSDSKALSFLPLSHVYERMLNYHYQYKGISIYYAENMGTIADDLRSVKHQ